MFDQGQCFLCQPDKELVVKSCGDIFLMVGLGPITPRYLMIAATSHIPSFADMYVQNHGIAADIQTLRDELQYGNEQLLMTEHGRVPVCRDEGDEHDAHCFHAHFLLFQSAKDIEEAASGYFMNSEHFETLGDALAFAATCENYHLLSPHSNKFVVFTGALNVPRQFFRYMVALAEDQAACADWRLLPNRESAISAAASERLKYGG